MDFKDLEEVDAFIENYLIFNGQPELTHIILAHFMKKLNELGYNFLNHSGMMRQDVVMIMFTLFIAGYRSGHEDWR